MRIKLPVNTMRKIKIIVPVAVNIAIMTLLPLLLSGQPLSERSEKTRILFILDCSQSMSGHWDGVKKIDIARKFLGRTVDSLAGFDNVEMALRVYGHQSVVPPQDCNDTRLEVAFSPGNAYRIKRKMLGLSPKGTTPIANSLAAAAGDFGECAGCRNVIILITDGIEACDGDPCAVSLELQKRGIILKPFIIGIGLDSELAGTFDCLGNVYNANTEERFEEVLDIVISHALTETSLQVNLIDGFGFPSETNVAMTFYNLQTGHIKYNFIHTMNHRGVPDTLRIDPLLDYRIMVHTLPPVSYDSLKLAPGKHNTVAVDAPRGSLLIEQEKGMQYKDLLFIVRQDGKMKTLCRQKINERKKYITGKYDIEIPTLPLTELKDIEIRPGEQTTVTIPQPGVITFLVDNPGICELFTEKEGDVEWIYTIDTREKSIPLNLLPGSYRVIYRALHAKATHYTIEKKFRIESGRSSSLRIF
ncbi:MAG: VWA domain-containing protein [Bacteroidales bacterium]|jgi:Ca-activated chloride channel family protein|nr:VWA domain-containing protein [Bacteroidales bacterium]